MTQPKVSTIPVILIKLLWPASTEAYNATYLYKSKEEFGSLEDMVALKPASVIYSPKLTINIKEENTDDLKKPHNVTLVPGEEMAALLKHIITKKLGAYAVNYTVGIHSSRDLESIADIVRTNDKYRRNGK